MVMVSKCLKGNRTELKPIEAERRRGSPSQVDGGCVNRLHHHRHFLASSLSSLSFFSIIIVITVTFFVIIIVNTVFVIIIVNTVFVIIILFSSPSSSYHRYSCCHYLCLNAMIHCNHHNCHNQYIVIETELPVRRGEGPEFEAFEDRETVPGPGFAYF